MVALHLTSYQEKKTPSIPWYPENVDKAQVWAKALQTQAKIWYARPSATERGMPPLVSRVVDDPRLLVDPDLRAALERRYQLGRQYMPDGSYVLSRQH